MLVMPLRRLSAADRSGPARRANPARRGKCADPAPRRRKDRRRARCTGIDANALNPFNWLTGQFRNASSRLWQKAFIVGPALAPADGVIGMRKILILALATAAAIVPVATV